MKAADARLRDDRAVGPQEQLLETAMLQNQKIPGAAGSKDQTVIANIQTL